MAQVFELPPQQTNERFGGLITLDPETRKARLCFTVFGSYDVSLSGVPGSFEYWLVMPIEGLPDSARGLLGCIDTTMRSDFSIPGGNRIWTDPEVGDVFRLQWSDFSPVSPPEEDTPA